MPRNPLPPILEAEAHFVTLILTINGPETIWLLADRRLSNNGSVVRDDARKAMFLETTDGVAILGYAGLGATARGTEPADWMSAVLRGSNRALEQSLDVLAAAMKRQFPRHMAGLKGNGGPAHHVLITAFLSNEARFYTIDLALSPDRMSYAFRKTRWVAGKAPARVRTPRVGIGGSGAHYLMRDKTWMRCILGIVKAHAGGRVSALAVADRLASLNHQVHLGASDKSVGPRCVVAWRNRKGGIHKDGGATQYYTGIEREFRSGCLPTVATGLNIAPFANAVMARMLKHGPPKSLADQQELFNKDVWRLYEEPDEDLR
jgi:hypothetical protein